MLIDGLGRDGIERPKQIDAGTLGAVRQVDTAEQAESWTSKREVTFGCHSGFAASPIVVELSRMPDNSQGEPLLVYTIDFPGV